MPLTVGIVGAGAIVEKSHLPVLRATRELSVIWLADINMRKARSLGEAHGVKAVDLSSGLDSLPPADVVLLAIPLGARPPYYEVLSTGSSALYVEKPIARTLKDHQQLCSWFPDYRLGCGFQRRSSGAIQLLRRTITERLFGDLRLIRFGWGGPGSSGGDGFLSDLGLAAGGVLAEQAIHGIDAMQFCAGAEAIYPENVRMSTLRGFDLHTEAKVSLRCCQGSVDCEITVSLLHDTINGTEYHFDRGMLFHSFDDAIHVGSIGRKGHFCRLQPPSGVQYPLGPYQCLYQHWRTFIHGLQEKQSNWTSAASALLTTELIETLYQSGHPFNPKPCSR